MARRRKYDEWKSKLSLDRYLECPSSKIWGINGSAGSNRALEGNESLANAIVSERSCSETELINIVSYAAAYCACAAV